MDRRRPNLFFEKRPPLSAFAGNILPRNDQPLDPHLAWGFMTTSRRASFVAVLLGIFPLLASDNHLITLGVVVAEKSGAPLLGLQERDFTLLDNKEPQRIVSFRGPTAAGEDKTEEVIILMDEVNIAYSGVSQTTVQVEKFLGQNGGRLTIPASLIFFTDKGLSIEHAAPQSPTQDGHALIAELRANRAPLRVIGRSQGFYGAGDRVDLCRCARLANWQTSKGQSRDGNCWCGSVRAGRCFPVRTRI